MFRRIKKICHKFDMNFEFLSKIIVFEIFQFAMRRRFNNALIHFFVSYVFLSKINDVLRKCLQMTNIMMFNSSDKARMKSIAIM